ncbi:DUF3016 domain-containing protein [Pseudoalteromonas denitrificans]|uniref:DUF3016 domain-containing protein n=1 Tax=Pseudoalteromonas denitrificans DSM 6059 TaxID=1123010 RepID=A0A1I1J9H8_9GAMM|nr:DUF3016 domain-containing protein [Pseudoalteromonas denitrificans]SFC45259.1 Protein of unknown function [Pseudoalteromonas denitrificans DSM 6059]
MKKINKVAIALVLSIPLLVNASDNSNKIKATVTWADFNDFTDVRPNGGPKGSFYKQVAKSFEKHFAKLAKDLPLGYKLKVKVNNLDLAGDVRFSTHRDMRIIKPIYFPKIEFSYALIDANGKLINKDDVKLKDMGFMDKIKHGRDGSFYYDHRLITDWFNDVLIKQV